MVSYDKVITHRSEVRMNKALVYVTVLGLCLPNVLTASEFICQPSSGGQLRYQDGEWTMSASSGGSLLILVRPDEPYMEVLGNFGREYGSGSCLIQQDGFLTCVDHSSHMSFDPNTQLLNRSIFIGGLLRSGDETQDYSAVTLSLYSCMQI